MATIGALLAVTVLLIAKSFLDDYMGRVGKTARVILLRRIWFGAAWLLVVLTGINAIVVVTRDFF